MQLGMPILGTTDGNNAFLLGYPADSINETNSVMLTFRILLIVACIAALTQCVDAETTTIEGVEYFEKHVRPVFATHCYSCHSVKKQEREGGLVLDRREGRETGGDSGAAIIPGDIPFRRQ